MKNILLSSLISVSTTLLILLVIWNFAPMSWVLNETVGASVTEINSSDQLSDFPTTYNANLNALNDGKLEISDFLATTSMPNLATVGTLTTGTWNATTIGGAYGGTGSTSLSQYHVLLGNGASGVGIVSGLGSSGQSLVSQGAGSPPVWTSVGVDETEYYNWTNQHDFTSLFVASASATDLTINAVDYTWPSSVLASTTVLKSSAAGALTWDYPDWGLLVSSTTAQSITFATVTIPRITSDIEIRANLAATDESTSCHSLAMRFNGDSNLSNYDYIANVGTFASTTESGVSTPNATGIVFFKALNAPARGTNKLHLVMQIDNSSTTKNFYSWSGGVTDNDIWGHGSYSGGQITSVSFACYQNSGVSFGGGGVIDQDSRINIYGSRD